MRPISKKLVLFTVSKLSWLICPALRLWSKRYLKGMTKPNWLFLKLKFHLQLRILQRARLVTGQEIDVDPFDDVGGAIASNGSHEPATVVYQKLLAPGMVVFDVGAHIGQYTLVASQFVGDGGWVHSFEPDPITFKQLQSNVRLNGYTSVTCNPIALSNRYGTATLYLFYNSGMNSLQPLEEWYRHHVEVLLTTIDEYVKAMALPRLDLLKADVEGTELHVLKGGHETLKRFHPYLIIELSAHSGRFGYEPDDLVRYLEALDYQTFIIQAIQLSRYKAGENDCNVFNVLAVHESGINSLQEKGMLAHS